jgi:hypothetical protein
MATRKAGRKGSRKAGRKTLRKTMMGNKKAMMGGNKTMMGNKKEMMGGNKTMMGNKKEMMGGKRGGTPWTKFVKKMHTELKKKNPKASLGDAMKLASRRKGEM